jgi:hypothetical protein
MDLRVDQCIDFRIGVSESGMSHVCKSCTTSPACVTAPPIAATT